MHTCAPVDLANEHRVCRVGQRLLYLVAFPVQDVLKVAPLNPSSMNSISLFKRSPSDATRSRNADIWLAIVLASACRSEETRAYDGCLFRECHATSSLVYVACSDLIRDRSTSLGAVNERICCRVNRQQYLISQLQYLLRDPGRFKNHSDLQVAGPLRSWI